jgi:hypothetical protein
VGLAGLYGLFDGLLVRVGEREDLARVRVLSDHGYEAPFVVANVLRRAHRTGIPASLILFLTSAIVYSPK